MQVPRYYHVIPSLHNGVLHIHHGNTMLVWTWQDYVEICIMKNKGNTLVYCMNMVIIQNHDIYIYTVYIKVPWHYHLIPSLYHYNVPVKLHIVRQCFKIRHDKRPYNTHRFECSKVMFRFTMAMSSLKADTQQPSADYKQQEHVLSVCS